MNLIAIDPGSTESAWVLLQSGKIVKHSKVPNVYLAEALRGEFDPSHLLAIEMIASYGMAVGKEVFDTCVWIGRFMEAWAVRGGAVQLIYRREVKLFHCETSMANDANIRASLIDRYGPGKDTAIGKKSAPGPLFGIKGDEWSALAVALTAEAKSQPLAERPF